MKSLKSVYRAKVDLLESLSVLVKLTIPNLKKLANGK